MGRNVHLGDADVTVFQNDVMSRVSGNLNYSWGPGLSRQEQGSPTHKGTATQGLHFWILAGSAALDLALKSGEKTTAPLPGSWQ